ncbi:MAG: multifunctional oxoglutarate decarboxylase/oxoglutarate dehydrogenase thiamine pyrophosphate-binding subunit/dihydrolipoyllysine-residue succinyltransferase subunit [Candidatus Nanopelagicales bacterium]
MANETPIPIAGSGFGPNEWIVDEIYEQFKKDKNLVDPAWWEFFNDYTPQEKPVSKPAQSTVTPVLTTPIVTEPVVPTPPTAPVVNEEPKESTTEPLKGVAARVVTNMEASLTVPTATSVRSIPAILLQENRVFINEHLARRRGGKVSFTHLIGFAVVKALKAIPDMNVAYTQIDNKPAIVKHGQIGLGLAIDITKPDGSRQLLVPAIKNAENLDFAQFWATYDDIVKRARTNKLTVEDFAGVTVSLTNPGTIGTQHSVPRLMQNQGLIVGVGSLDYPMEWQGASQFTLAKQAVSKVLTMSSTYDHRIIQGAQSGEFLKHVADLLMGKEGFYEEIFTALQIPYKPYRWAQDIAAEQDEDINKVARVQALIRSYRVFGHLISDTDPLVYAQRTHPDLTMAAHGLSVWDLEREFATGGFGESRFMKLRDVLTRLRDTYSRSIGIEYMHIQDPDQRKWVQDQVEIPYEKPPRNEQLRILGRLNAAEAFEKFLQTKYVGQKRFSLEGSESTIVALDSILNEAAKNKLHEVAIAMPHRGRLNVLANIAGKSYGQIFKEFEDVGGRGLVQGSGDVKYHLGTTGVFSTDDGETIPVYLAANPSHLEAVNPVLEGIVRAKQDRLGKDHNNPILPILLHGDAAFAGQGVVFETLNLSKLRGYRTGGTVHLIVNNQVGFTTGPAESRSSTYASDLARTIQAPIFHVNGDDPEAVAYVAELAFNFRQEFKVDVVIDLITYRRRGHNEADDPSLTQPLMYKIIDQKRSIRKLYTESLIGRGDITLEEAEQALIDYQSQLERAFAETKEAIKQPAQTSEEENSSFPIHVDTAISEELVEKIAQTQINLRPGFTPHPRLKPQLERRYQMVKENAIDWAMGETLAFGSLLAQGVSVRLAGQDSRRGTFGQRHAVIVDNITGEGHKPLKAVAQNSRFFVYDSALTEFAGMGFEYGYSVSNPEMLVCWEAQFGDFANGAQTIIDEFVVSGEQKWNQHSRLVLLLPHGMEGQGPDHSSGRLERFLSLAAQDNMTIVQPSTSASYFHFLRWQVLNPHVKPMIIFTPKSMLRAKSAMSPTSEFTQGKLSSIIVDAVDVNKVKKIVFATGKFSHEIAAEREKQNREDVAIIRIERLYPLPKSEIQTALARFTNAQNFVWAQEEPANQGAYPFMALELIPLLPKPLTRISRAASSAPAVGSHTTHEHEQAELLQSVLLS